MMVEWKTTACILCECNCGLEISLGGQDGRRFEKIRGDKRHPASRGYTCEKPLRLDRYQNGRAGCPLSPLRRRPDGSFEEIGWDTAIAEISARLAAIGAEHGGESIFYYGGGGQGNHLGGAYSKATMAAYGARFRSSALAQEKTGEFWVNAQMLGAALARANFAEAEVGVFVGKNPWQSHGFPHARPTLRELSRDPDRALIVIDPRRTETAVLADFHLQVRPGRDAWLLAAMVAVVVQEQLEAGAWLAEHAVGLDRIRRQFGGLDVCSWCETAGVPEELVRAAVRRIAAAETVAFFEDLGVQMNHNSTLVSYLEKLVWLLTGNFARPGTACIPAPLVPLATARPGAPLDAVVTPVTGFPVIGGLVACNVIPEEILTDHPRRFRAMLVESSNPAHSLADSQRMRAALESLDLLVVIDVAMTETARLADYVLPAPTQFEKYEATFFNFEFPRNVFQLRPPVLPAPQGPLPEPEIHARLVEAAGVLDAGVVGRLRAAAEAGRDQFAAAFFEATSADPMLARLAPVLLYRTLGPTLPGGAAAAAVLWGAARLTAMACPDGVAEAGHGTGPAAGDRLFDAILAHPEGMVFSDESADPEAAVWGRVRTNDGRIHLTVPHVLEEVQALAATPPPGPTREWPLVLSAGERRSFTANTIIRDPEWRRRDREGALRVAPADAAGLGIQDGDRALLETPRGRAVVVVSLDDGRQPGHVALPNGLGTDHREQPTGHQLSDPASGPAAHGTQVVTGVAPNELTGSFARDRFAGTPWHKFVPARLTALHKQHR